MNPKIKKECGSMNPDVKKRWIEALRSGKYAQGKLQLKSVNNQYCCLGVLCDLHSIETGQKWVNDRYYGRPDVLPTAVQLWAGLTSDPRINGELLSYMNDILNYNFDQIADRIEKCL